MVTRPLNCDVMRHRTLIAGSVVAVLAGIVAISTGIDAPRERVGVAPPAQSEHAAAEAIRPRMDAQRSNGDNREPGLREASQSFRHTTFLVAIRHAGFYCDDVIESHESAEDVWVVGCRDLGGYKISVRGMEVVHAEPMPHNVDAVF